MTEFQQKNIGSFTQLKLNSEIKKSLKYQGFELLTPIQRKAIPHIMMGKDTVVCSRTGSGKTLAYLVPIIQKLVSRPGKELRCLALVPNRELALQSYKVAKSLTRHTQLSPAVIIGGRDLKGQEDLMLKSKHDILIATPGRLTQLLDLSKISCQDVEYLILDEADTLLEKGFRDQTLTIVNLLPNQRQNIFLSATMPPFLETFIKDLVCNPIFISNEGEDKLSPELKLDFFPCMSDDHEFLFFKLISDLYRNNQRKLVPLTLVFVATHFHAEYLGEVLKKLNFNCINLHGGLDQATRDRNLACFSKREKPILIVTDVIARGLDIPSVDFVVNYHVPLDVKLFIHRVGRTARNGSPGSAITIFRTNERKYFEKIVSTLELNSNPNFKLNNQIEAHSLMSFRSIAEKIVESDSFVESLRQTAQNAEKMYFKTVGRPEKSMILQKRQ